MNRLQIDDLSLSLPPAPTVAAGQKSALSSATAARAAAEREWGVTLELTRAEKKAFRDYNIPRFSSDYSREAKGYEKELKRIQETWELSHIGHWAVQDGKHRPSLRTLPIQAREMIELHTLRKKGRHALLFGKLRGYEGRLTYHDLGEMLDLSLTYTNAILYRTEMLSIIILHIQGHRVLSAEDTDILKRARTVLSKDSAKIDPENSQFIKSILDKLNSLLKDTDHQDRLAAELDTLTDTRAEVTKMERQGALSPADLELLQTIHRDQPALTARIDALLAPHLEHAIEARDRSILRLMAQFPGEISLRATLTLRDLDRPVS